MRNAASSSRVDGRLLFLDVYRGLAVALMFAFNLIPLYSMHVPLLLQHGRLDRLLPGDFIAPAFQFIMGVSMAFARRRKRRVVVYWAKRVLGLFTLGYLLDMSMFRRLQVWGVLETLSLSFLLAFPMLWLSFTARAVALLSLFSAYCMLSLNQSFTSLVKSSPHGGVYALPAWATVTVIGSFYGEKLASSGEIGLRGWIASLSLTLLGFLLGAVFPLTKRLVTPSYIIASSGICAMMLACFTKLQHSLKPISKLGHLGKYALEAWILQYLYGYYPAFYLLGKVRFLGFMQASALTAGIMLATWATAMLLWKTGLKLKL